MDFLRRRVDSTLAGHWEKQEDVGGDCGGTDGYQECLEDRMSVTCEFI